MLFVRGQLDRSVTVIWVSYVPYSGLSLLVQFCAFSKGEDSTFSAWGNPTLGLPVTRTRILGLTTVALLGGAAVAGAGPVGFIGLAAPHIVRATVGHDYRIIIPLSMVVGGMLGLWADILGRVVAHPGEIAMGIVVALFGVPLFIVLVKRGLVTGV